MDHMDYIMALHLIMDCKCGWLISLRTWSFHMDLRQGRVIQNQIKEIKIHSFKVKIYSSSFKYKFKCSNQDFEGKYSSKKQKK